MIKLNNEEMVNICGGGISLKLSGFLGAAIVFVIGLIDGLMNPKKCN